MDDDSSNEIFKKKVRKRQGASTSVQHKYIWDRFHYILARIDNIPKFLSRVESIETVGCQALAKALKNNETQLMSKNNRP